MPISTVLPETRIISINQGVKPEHANKLFTRTLTSVANSAEKLATKPSTLFSFARAAWNGMKKIGAVLKSAVNVVDDLFGFNTPGRIDYLRMYDTVLKMAKYGIHQLFTEVILLLKEEAFPILIGWLKKVNENWAHMTPYHLLKTFIEAVRDNPRMRNLSEKVMV